MYTALLTELAELDLAYVHLEATADEEVLVDLRHAWPGTLIVNPAADGGDAGRPGRRRATGSGSARS